MPPDCPKGWGFTIKGVSQAQLPPLPDPKPPGFAASDARLVANHAHARDLDPRAVLAALGLSEGDAAADLGKH
jgi:hypothetical protein